jgi:hypothetical protein
MCTEKYARDNMCDEEFGSVSEKDTNKVVAVIYN